MKIYFCWKCNIEMPFLDEAEWQVISPLLKSSAEEIKQYRSKNQCDLKTARKNVKSSAMVIFEELTGRPGIHFDIIAHHRLSDWGQECKECGNLLRTSKAIMCAKCGFKSNAFGRAYAGNPAIG
ncbi:MAG: hypothetical protein GY797_26385 [Deltaproteobacteria bacterium]|nr:hypothetical protein [Deltaproteobacteria bacterium]